MKRRQAKKVEARRDQGAGYRSLTVRRSARVLARDVLRAHPRERLPYVAPTITELGFLGVLFGSCD